MQNSVVVLSGPHELATVAIDLGDLPGGWVRVRFLYCGLCGSDRSKYVGRHGQTYPVSIGHEFVAEVEAVGADVECLAVGDLVTSDLNHRCGHCDHCSAGRSHLCRAGQVGGFTNRALAARGDIEAPYLFRLDSALPHLTLVEPLSCVLHSLAWADLKGSERILIIGAGGLGACLSFALVEDTPAVFDVAEVDDARRAVIGAAIGDRGRALAEPEGEYDVVFDLSGTEEGIAAGCRHVRAGGRLCTMTHLRQPGGAPFLLDALTRRDVTFTVSYLNGPVETVHRSIALLQHCWGLQWDPLIGVVPLADLDGALGDHLPRRSCRVVVDVGAAFS